MHFLILARARKQCLSVSLQLLPECPSQIYQFLLLAVMDVLALPLEVTVGHSPEEALSISCCWKWWVSWKPVQCCRTSGPQPGCLHLPGAAPAELDDAGLPEKGILQKLPERMCSHVLFMTRRVCLVITQPSLSVPTNGARDMKDFHSPPGV